jgi:hypothetical protein
MADIADLAFDSEQRHFMSALAAQRSQRTGLRPIGSCHNCGDESIGPRLFCDADCAEDWEYADSLRRKLGMSTSVY